MNFKNWLYKEIGGNGPMGEPPKQFIPVTALDGIYDKSEDPPKPKKPTATKNYLWTKRYCRKK